ncbi:MAG: tol-pal system protein YbgF [Alphaproteobacteria bacterium]
MKPLYRSLAILACAALLGAPVAQAETTEERMQSLERQIVLAQNQTRQRVITSRNSGGSAADLELRLSAMEEAIRELRGTIEENDYQVRKLSENLEKFQKDTQFRFSEISTGSATAGATPSAAEPMVSVSKPAPEPVLTMAPREEEVPAPADATGETSAGDGVLRTPSYEHPDYSNPRDLYNYAFRLLNQTKYEQSADAFGMFIRNYPQDPLIGNAYYWQGETFYIRRDYVNAADAFRQGFETLPNGPKAPDNLLKLAMSLNALERDKEACIVLKQITTKYSRQSVNVAEKASSEQRRIGCA